jgi:hypothetical protein
VYRSLQADRIVETADRLAARVGERFPGSGLSKVAAELAETARRAAARCVAIRRPDLLLRGLVGALLLAAAGAVAFLLSHLEATREMWRIENFFSETADFMGTVVFTGAAAVFLLTLEGRRKRARALDAVGELRALAHIVDMHQLTKDPEYVLGRGDPTPASPPRTMTPFELGRYFDYCSEMLSVASKVGALYVQALPDPVALEAADDLEALCTGLSRKIWQKIAILDRYARTRPGDSVSD